MDTGIGSGRRPYKAKRKSHVGARHAFLSLEAQGKGRCSDALAEKPRMYKDIKAAGGAQWQRLAELGSLGRKARREVGCPAFRAAARGKKRSLVIADDFRDSVQHVLSVYDLDGAALSDRLGEFRTARRKARRSEQQEAAASGGRIACMVRQAEVGDEQRFRSVP